ncbi:Lysophospholipase [Commensalibacter communis]|uniref:Alpha-beta hydrolase superfamily (PldB) n=1 Tax=Commensalibacter communis TaxID=2972786 RepID=A0A9W4TLV1_9PROT|nr:alpha/beta fold hydrolase [Commensalibacter communis]CAI3936234.1 Lysophospholipase [Commensalibacter communis]CAI3942591.1 Lysophospholipase [Commensalibacter communis]CAI3944103.1 Lysophospholipase [Commensalibacter communis]CAI3947229.1 Lysophospholipase [Commensalibacter communis]
MRILNRSFLTHFCRMCFSFIMGCSFLGGNSHNAQAKNSQKTVEMAQQTNATDPYANYKTLVPASEWLTLSDGAKIPLRIWQAPSQRAIIFALHGFNDSRDAWEDSAEYFVNKGISIYSPDQRGFGQAPLRGKWSSTDRMVQDVAEEVTIIKNRFPNTPIYLMGESMGGAVLMCLAARDDAPQVNGYILLAPAVWGSKQIGVIGDVSLRFLNLIAPNWQLNPSKAPVKRVTASDNNDSLIRLYFNPLTLHNTRVKALHGLVKLMDDAIKAAPRVRYHSLVQYGDNDQLVPSASMYSVWEKFPKWVRKDYVPNGYHLLLRDQNRKIVAKDIISWMNDPDQWLPSGGDTAAAAWMSVKGKGQVPFFVPSQVDNIVQ